MLKSKFNMLLDDMQKFIDKRIETNGKIADLNQNGVKIYSHDKIESDIAILREKLNVFCNEKMQAAESIIASIMEELETMRNTLDLGELQPLFTYLQGAGEQASVKIVENQIVRFAGNADAVQAIYETATNCKCSVSVLNVIHDYFVDTDKIETDLYKACSDVYISGGSASDGGCKIAAISKHCGAPVECNISDVETDVNIFRKALGINRA